MKNSSKVFIGSPVYNSEKTISMAISSLLNQTHSNFQLLISDNFSTDKTKIVLEKFLDDSRITYHCHEKNTGAQQNFLFLLEKAAESDCEFFMWAAGDDFWHKTFLSDCLSVLKTNQNIAMAFPKSIVKSLNYPFFKFTVDERMDFLSSLNAQERVEKYILMDCRTHKANCIYGLWRKESIVNAYFHIKKNHPNILTEPIDVSFLVFLIARFPMKQLEKVLFEKRYFGIPPGHYFKRLIKPLRDAARLLKGEQFVDKKMKMDLIEQLRMLKELLLKEGFDYKITEKMIEKKLRIAKLE